MIPQSNKKDKKLPEEKKAEKINIDDNYLNYNLLKEILKETNIPKKVIEEKNSELFYETLTGNGEILFINNMKYSGPVKNGILESGPEKIECNIEFADGTKYTGEIHNNKISGEGKYIFPSGATYEGELLNGLRNGKGKYISLEGITYDGEWKNGLKNGKGIMNTNEMCYEGEWSMGKIFGKGKLKWKNGNFYEGNFKNNNINGLGFMIWHNLNEKYIGNWKNNKQNGNGIHIWYEPKGELKEMRNRYVGEWENGIRSGYGVFFYSNGSIYEGMWKNNMKHGFGVMTFEDGKNYVGRFVEDRIVDKEMQLTAKMVSKLLEDYYKNKNNDEKNCNDVKGKVNDIYQSPDLKKILGKNNSNKSINKNVVNKNISNKNINKVNNSKKVSSSPTSNSKSKPKNNENNKQNIDNTVNSNKTNNLNKIGNNNDNKKTTNNLEVIEEENTMRRNRSIGTLNKANSLNSNLNNNSGKLNDPENKNQKSKVLNVSNSTKLIGINNLKTEKFMPVFDLTDLIKEHPLSVIDSEEISKIILRNLSYLKTIYQYLNKISRAEIFNEETNSSKLIIRDDFKQPDEKIKSEKNDKKKPLVLNKSSRKKMSFSVNNNSNNITISLNQKQTQIKEEVRSDEVSFCISMSDVWIFLREGGIINENLSICDFDRLFSRGANTVYETYQIPEEIKSSLEIYDYINSIIDDTKTEFIYKYNKYLEYYYKDSKIPKSMKINENYEKYQNNENKGCGIKKNDIHDKKRIILPRIFQECLIRASFGLYCYPNYSLELHNSKLSQKLQTVLDMVIPSGLKKKTTGSTRSSHSKLEQSFNASLVVLESKNKIRDRKLKIEFMNLFQNELKIFYNKLYNYSKQITINPNNGDETIEYGLFYSKIILTNENLQKLIPNKLTFVELITSEFKEKNTPTENEKNSVEVYNYVNKFFCREMVEYEFNELIFNICKNYFISENLKGTYNDYKKIFEILANSFNKIDNKIQNKRKKYFYPITIAQEMKQKLIDEENARIEAEKRKRLERKRYIRERELMDKEENENAFKVDHGTEEEEDFDDEEDDFYT